MPTPGTASGEAIAVTGVGAVSGCGWGIDATWASVCSGRAAIGPFDRFDHREHRTHLASPAPEMPEWARTAVDACCGTSPDRDPRRISAADHFALAATAEALAGAGLDLAATAARRTGVFFGTSTSGMLEAEQAFARILAGGALRPTPLAGQPMNVPGDRVARAVRARGPVLTISSACTSGALAIAAGLDALRAGEVELALAGGSDELCQLTYAGFNSLRAVDPEPCRPFRAERAGLTLGEGAAVLVLEPLTTALARGALPLALLLGAGSTCDAEHMTAPAVGGTGAARAIHEALADAGLDPGAVDFVNAHGTGTPLNDAAEAAAIAAVFGSRAATLPVTSTKGVVGHLLGAAGAFEAVVTILCLRERTVHPTPGAGSPDPEAPVALVRDRPLALPTARVGLSTSLAFGGSNAALVFADPTGASRAEKPR